VALTWLFLKKNYLFLIVHIIFYFLKYLKINFKKSKKSEKYSDFFPKNLKIEKIIFFFQILKKPEKTIRFFRNFWFFFEIQILKKSEKNIRVYIIYFFKDSRV